MRSGGRKTKDEGRKTRVHPSFVFRLSSFYLLLIRWAFQRFYNEFAWTYDVVAWLVSRGYWRHWIAAAVPYTHGRVLELGCGTGYAQLALAQRGRTHVGLDASPYMLAHTRARLRHHGLYVSLVQSLAQDLPFASATFQTVLATFPTAYIIDPRTLHEVRRLLVPGGQLLVVDAATFSDHGLYERAIDLLYRVTLQGSTRAIPDPVPRDPRIDALEQAGFVVTVHWATVGPTRVMIVEAT